VHGGSFDGNSVFVTFHEGRKAINIRLIRARSGCFGKECDIREDRTLRGCTIERRCGLFLEGKAEGMTVLHRTARKGSLKKERTADRLVNHFEGSSCLRLLFRYSLGPPAAWPCGLALTFLRHYRIEFTA
jgi:hypothetical protein